MNPTMTKRTALFSLHDTTDADIFAGQLIAMGWDIIGSSETVELLSRHGLPVIDIAEFTGVSTNYGFPPTLHPKVEYALTGKQGPAIDLVYVIPYPEAVGNDVGGRTLLALATKGCRIAVMNQDDMRAVISSLHISSDLPEELRTNLADKVSYNLVVHYASLITGNDHYKAMCSTFSSKLMNGENPYQVPAAILEDCNTDDPLAIPQFERLSGELPCFTNIANLDCILTTLLMAAEAFRRNLGHVPHICIAAKHGNPCGLAVSFSTPEHAVEKALWGNPLAVWGGEIITNFAIDELLAATLHKSARRENELGNPFWMLDVIAAPDFSVTSREILGQRASRKLLKNIHLETLAPTSQRFQYRHIRGGLLQQPPADYVLDLNTCDRVSSAFDDTAVADLIIAWAVAYSSNHGGNEIALAKAGALLSAGGGPSTVEAARMAVLRARDNGHSLDQAVFAADAFFPFTDAPEVLCNAGITRGLVPAGGKKEADVRSYFKAHATHVAYIPEQFRGFCRH